MMRDEIQMSQLAAQTERWFWHSQSYQKCECCGLWGHIDDEFTDHVDKTACNACVADAEAYAEAQDERCGL